MFEQLTLRHIPPLFLSTAITIGSFTPFFRNSEYALRLFGFPNDIAANKAAWPLIKVMSARVSTIGTISVSQLLHIISSQPDRHRVVAPVPGRPSGGHGHPFRINGLDGVDRWVGLCKRWDARVCNVPRYDYGCGCAVGYAWYDIGEVLLGCGHIKISHQELHGLQNNAPSLIVRRELNVRS